ncbi:MAG: glycosyltransferase family 8 protein [Oscillospiraceae bacterium]|nr:glycosyltransferase family 8 protein [Oscillospiraceae bacterium]
MEFFKKKSGSFKFFIFILSFAVLLGLFFVAPKINGYIRKNMRGNLVFGTPQIEQNLSDGVVVVITIDDGYCYQAIVALTSLLINANENTFYKINVFVPKHFTDESKKKILKLQEIYGKKCAIEFISMENCFTNSYVSAHFTNAVYYRLRCPSVLSQRKRCIYLDTDILVCRDLTELFNVDLKGNLLGGVADSARGYRNETERIERESYKNAFNLKDLNGYINSGVLVWDLEACRESKIEEKFKSFLEKYKNPSQHDQTAINATCEGRILSLPFRFNTQAYMFSGKPYGQDDFSKIFQKEEWIKGWEEPCIIHYAGEKPWIDPSTYWIELWWETARKTPFFKEILKKFRTTK